MQSPLDEGVDVKAADCMGPHYLFVIHALFLLDSFDPRLLKKHRSVNRCFSRGTKGTNNQCDVAVVTLSVCLLKCEMLVSVC